MGGFFAAKEWPGVGSLTNLKSGTSSVLSLLNQAC